MEKVKADKSVKLGWQDEIKLFWAKKKQPLTEVKSRQTLGGELFNRIFSSLETKVSGIALQPEESTTQPDFPSSVELTFNIDG